MLSAGAPRARSPKGKLRAWDGDLVAHRQDRLIHRVVRSLDRNQRDIQDQVRVGRAHDLFRLRGTPPLRSVSEVRRDEKQPALADLPSAYAEVHPPAYLHRPR